MYIYIHAIYTYIYMYIHIHAIYIYIYTLAQDKKCGRGFIPAIHSVFPPTTLGEQSLCCCRDAVSICYTKPTTGFPTGPLGFPKVHWVSRRSIGFPTDPLGFPQVHGVSHRSNGFPTGPLYNGK